MYNKNLKCEWIAAFLNQVHNLNFILHSMKSIQVAMNQEIIFSSVFRVLFDNNLTNIYIERDHIVSKTSDP
jgi:hypothetical protein